MRFREYFLNILRQRLNRNKLGSKPVTEKMLGAFTQYNIEMAVQLYRNLKRYGCTFEDLIAFLDKQSEELKHKATRQAVAIAKGQLTREEKRRLKHTRATGRRSR